MSVTLLFLGAQALAEAPVIDLVSNEELRVMTRLENELLALGYRVVRRSPEDAPTSGARGEVVCTPKQLVARVFALQPRVATFDDPNDDAVWAIRVTEWLRSDASVLSAPATPALVPVVSAERTPWRLDLSARGVARWSPSLGVGGGVSASLAVWPWQHFGFEVTVPGLTWLQVSRDGAVASLREAALSLRGLGLITLSVHWAVLLGAGVGARHVFVEGVTPVKRGVERVVAEASAVAALRWHPVASFFLEWRNEVGVTMPAVALEFGGTRIGLVGVPGLQTSLGAGLSW